MCQVQEIADKLQPEVIVKGSLFPEPIKIITTIALGESLKVIGSGVKSQKTYQPILNLEQLLQLEISPETEPFDGKAEHFRLGIEAFRWGLAYEYDPYFSLAIARVDPLPHQLEAVYDYFLKLARVRFLLADDPGAGKTIMAGLLIKELKIRGLAQRILIVAPANLTFQWQRELKDKFREDFDVIKGDILRANYGKNPWQENNQVVTSISWVSRIEDAKESLLRSHWDLVIVDEAHKMSAYSSDKKTLAYQLGERLSQMTDHYLLMTATPHKGDPANFCLFLELLDKDVYGDVKSLEEAMQRNTAPFYLRRTKEALVTFPDPHTGEVTKLFTNRRVETIEFFIDNDEKYFYDALTRYVEDQSIKASQDDSARGRALGFTMAMLQRRFASSIYAVRRSLERMKDKRERILENPEAYRREQISRKLPEDFNDLTEAEQQRIIDDLESVVASVEPEDLRDEIAQLSRLITLALDLEKREVESKLVKLRDVITEQGMFLNQGRKEPNHVQGNGETIENNPKVVTSQDDRAYVPMKLLIFTEHKDTLDYLVEKLRGWGLSVTQIHGGMKIGDRDTPNTRIYAEREFRESAQVLVATEAAGEGINLQFCWFMINYDIPWNPIRLEQRMGRIHRYGQEKDCLIFNFVSMNTREGRVLWKLFDRIRAIESDLDPNGTGFIFNVLGDIFPANQLERLIRDMYAHNQTEDSIKARIVEQVDKKHFQQITDSALEGLVKRELNLSKIIGQTAEAKEKRLVPEAIADFFLQAASLAGIQPKEVKKQPHTYRIGKLPRTLWSIGDELETRFGKLGREYKTICFDQKLLQDDPTLEWVTPGHPLFETVRESVIRQTQEALARGAVFYDLKRTSPSCLDVFSASITDGKARSLHQRLFVVETTDTGEMYIRQPTIFLDLTLPDGEVNIPDKNLLPNRQQVEQALLEKALEPFLTEIKAQREKEITTIENHLEISLNTVIDKVQCQFAELIMQKESGSTETGLDGRIQQFENRLFELNGRLESRREELQQEKNCTIGNIHHHGRAWVIPHPERHSPEIAKMVSNAEIERIAIEKAMEFEQQRGWKVESVETQNRGFDLISRKPHTEDEQTAVAVRFIEVKGRAGVDGVALTNNEYKKASQLKDDYWLYVVFNCATNPEIHLIQNPVKLGWKPLIKVEHYQVDAEEILEFRM